MGLWRPTYLVELLDDPAATDAEGTVYTVKVMHGDQLRAELEAAKHRVRTSGEDAHVLGLTSLWCWAAMARTGDTDLGWPDWRKRVAVIERVKAPDEAPAPGDPDPSLDPTHPDTRSG